MNTVSRLRPSPAIIVAMAALVLALSGAAIALPGQNKVKSNDIADGAVKTRDIARGAVGSVQVKGKSLRGNRLKNKAVGTKQIADAAITGAQVAPDALDDSHISDFEVVGPVKAAATEGADFDAARTAAPETKLFEKGQLSIYAKCLRDATNDLGYGVVYIKSTANGAVFLSNQDFLDGGPTAADFLNANTDESDREIALVQAGTDDGQLNTSEFTALAADGASMLSGEITVASKNGTLAEGDGVYGAGNGCLFGIHVVG